MVGGLYAFSMRLRRATRLVRLFQPCDRQSVKSDKYVEHGTAIVKLVPAPIRRILLALAKETED